MGIMAFRERIHERETIVQNPSIHPPIHYNFIPDQTYLELLGEVEQKKKKRAKKLTKWVCNESRNNESTTIYIF